MSPWLTRRGRTLRHAALVAMGAAASSWLLYVVLTNARSLQYLQSWAEEEGLSLSIDSGSTWIPGSWSLGDVRLASEGAWSISAERVRLDLKLLDWLGGHRHLSELVLEGARLEVVSPRAGGERAANAGDPGVKRSLPIGLEASLGRGRHGAHRIVIDHIAAKGDRVRVGGYELSGKLEYRARGATVFGPGDARVPGGLDFSDAQWRYTGTLVGTMSGRASVDLATTKNAPQSLRAALQRANWKVEAAGTLNDIGTLPVLAPMRPTLEGGSYRGSFSAIGDRVERAHLLLQARRATLAPGKLPPRWRTKSMVQRLSSRRGTSWGSSRPSTPSKRSPPYWTSSGRRVARNVPQVLIHDLGRMLLSQGWPPSAARICRLHAA